MVMLYDSTLVVSSEQTKWNLCFPVFNIQKAHPAKKKVLNKHNMMYVFQSFHIDRHG